MPLSNQMIVRPAGQDDVPSLVAFSAAMALETEGRELDRDRLREGTLAVLASPPHGFFLVAQLPHLDGRLIGQLMITYEWSDWRNAAFWWIQSVYVDPAWRRQGVFRRMHEEVLRLAKSKRGVCGVRLYVERSNTAAQTAYTHVGLQSSAYEIFEEDFVFGHSHASSSRTRR